MKGGGVIKLPVKPAQNQPLEKEPSLLRPAKSWTLNTCHTGYDAVPYLFRNIATSWHFHETPKLSYCR